MAFSLKKLSLLVLAPFMMLWFAMPGYAIFAHRASNGEDIGILILGGIINTSSNDNVALLKELSSGKVYAVKIGGLVQVNGGLKVTRIARKYIVLENKKNELHLVYQNKFEREFAKGIPEKSKQVLRALGEDFVTDGFERHSNKVRMTQTFRDNLINKELGNVLMQATAIPQYDGNMIKGFSLTEIVEGSIFEHAGFREYDLITSINGSPLNNIGATIKLLQGLKNAGSVEIEVMRSGAPVTIVASVE